MVRRHLLTLALLLAFTGLASAQRGKVFLTKEEALELAFEGCEVERSSVALTKEQKQRIAELSGHDFEKSLVYPYVATKDGELVGTAWFDVHRVRTLRETLMIVVDPEGRIARIEVLAFGEPTDYLPRASWYAQFRGKGLDETLSLKKGIKGVTGATLTARATTRAARQVLAVHRVWRASVEPPAPPPKPKPKPKEGEGEKKKGRDGSA